MKTTFLRTATCVALLPVTLGISGPVSGQEASRGTTELAEDAKRTVTSGDHPLNNAPATATPLTATRATDLGQITVTGTRIRGGMTPSPVITIGAEHIREQGFTDLGEVIRSVPQNFSGGQSPGVTGSGGPVANQNITGGSGLNLRGLGPDASLTLLNGRRLSYSGRFQAVDISAIPVEAVERVEIVADGASAIYGSDAVGGVGNVILKQDLEGFVFGTRYGHATGGGMSTWEHSVTTGAAWTGGGLIASYKHVSAEPIYAHQRDYTDHLIEPRTIRAGNDLRSGLVSGHHALGGGIEVRLDVLRTERDIESYTATAAAFTQLPYSTTTTLVSPAAEIPLPAGWTLTAGAAWGKDENNVRYFRTDLSTGASSVTVDNCYCNESRSYELGAEGPAFMGPGGEARLAVGAGYRKNGFADRNRITRSIEIDGEESARFAYAELSLPLVAARPGTTGPRRLDVLAAVRAEDYDSFGGVATPKLGLVYGINDGVTLKSSWGRSFKAPTLDQRFQSVVAYHYPVSILGGSGYPATATAVMLWGGNPGLRPERARTWTASLAFHPDAIPGLETELTWFNIDYTDRVLQPVANFSLGLANSDYAEYVRYSPTADELAGIAATSRIVDVLGVGYDPANVVAILDNRYLNAMRQRVEGLDLTATYRFGFRGGRLTLRGSASWLDLSQQTGVGQSPVGLTGTLFHPAARNARLGAVWDRGAFTASVFGNYTSGVTVNSAVVAAAQQKTASFSTFDATLRYSTGTGAGALSGIDIALSAQNLFDRAPPLYAPVSRTVVPFDSMNYSAVGRFVSLSASKHF